DLSLINSPEGRVVGAGAEGVEADQFALAIRLPIFGRVDEREVVRAHPLEDGDIALGIDDVARRLRGQALERVRAAGIEEAARVRSEERRVGKACGRRWWARD